MVSDGLLIPGYAQTRPSWGDLSIPRQETLGQNRAGNVQILEPVCGGGYRENVRAGFVERMAGERQRRRLGLPHGVQPAGNAADLHDVDHGQVTRTRRYRISHASGKPPVLTGLDRNRRDALADSSVAMQVIRGHRLLDPRQVEFRQTANTLNCARDRLRLVVVHHQLDIRPNDPSRLADDPHILFKTCSADLDFDRFESALN